jgi:hypothetical protein
MSLKIKLKQKEYGPLIDTLQTVPLWETIDEDKHGTVRRHRSERVGSYYIFLSVSEIVKHVINSVVGLSDLSDGKSINNWGIVTLE